MRGGGVALLEGTTRSLLKEGALITKREKSQGKKKLVKKNIEAADLRAEEAGNF